MPTVPIQDALPLLIDFLLHLSHQRLDVVDRECPRLARDDGAVPRCAAVAIDTIERRLLAFGGTQDFFSNCDWGETWGAR